MDEPISNTEIGSKEEGVGKNCGNAKEIASAASVMNANRVCKRCKKFSSSVD